MILDGLIRFYISSIVICVASHMILLAGTGFDESIEIGLRYKGVELPPQLVYLIPLVNNLLSVYFIGRILTLFINRRGR